MEQNDSEARYQPATGNEAPEAPRIDRRGFNRAKLEHGLNTMIRATRKLERRGLRVIDRRTATGRALWAWRTQLIEDLGGTEAVSTAQVALVDLCCRSKLILDSIDAWLMQQKRLVRKGSVLPVVMQRESIASGLTRNLQALGLERRARPVPTLEEVLASPMRRADSEEADK